MELVMLPPTPFSRSSNKTLPSSKTKYWDSLQMLLDTRTGNTGREVFEHSQPF